MTQTNDVFAICDQVREMRFTLHCYLHHRHLENVNENGAMLGHYDAHIAQLLGYLHGCRVKHSLLINFGAPKL